MAPELTSERAEHTLPQSLEAERSVLGAVLLDNQAFNAAAEVLVPEDFYGHAHRLIYEAMMALSEEDAPIDPVTLREELDRRDTLEKAGGRGFVASLMEGLPRAPNVGHYARIVKNKAALRRLISSANRIIDMAMAEEEDAEQIIDQAEQAIFQIGEDKVKRSFVSTQELALETMVEIEELSAGAELVTGVPTGFKRFDTMTTGLQPGDLVILAGRPSMGKSAMAANVGQHVALRAGGTVGLFSLEMSDKQLIRRFITSEARVDAHKLASGYLSDEDRDKLLTALGDLANAKIFIDDSASLTVMEMRAKARRLKAEHGLDLLIVDYLQLVRGGGRFENRNLEIGAISRALKALAKELDIPVLALSQLSRAPESRSEHRPQLSDLRESGNLEQDADVVCFIFREEVYNPHDPELQGLAEVIISKQRNGPIGTVKLAFLKEYTRFENLQEEW